MCRSWMTPSFLWLQCSFLLVFKLIRTHRTLALRTERFRKLQTMRATRRPSSQLARLFGHRFGLANHFVTLRLPNRGPFAPSRCFSPRFGHTRRCANLHQNGGHDAANLPWGHYVPLSFPGTIQGLHLDRLALPIGASPLFVRFAPGLRLAALKERPIFTSGSTAADPFGGRRPIQFPIALETKQSPHVQALTGAEKGTGGVPAIGQEPYFRRQQRNQALQLPYGHSDGRLAACDATLSENGSPTARRFRQEHHRRELPAHAHRFIRMRQIGQIDHSPIRAGFRFRARDAATVNADPDGSLVLPQQCCCPDSAPTSFIDTPVFQSFVDATPLAAKSQRERQFGQRPGLRFTAERIDQFKERVGAALKTAVALMTHLSYCVKVQSVNVLCLCLFRAKHFTPSGSSWQSQGCLLLALV